MTCNFPIGNSHIKHKSTKMRFQGNQPEMHQLDDYIISSKIVVWGWYMTHFDRRDLLKSKKKVWDGFHHLSVIPGPICDFPRIFREFRGGPRILEKPSSWTSESEKNVQKSIFFQFHKFSKKYDTWAPFWYIYIGHTPNRSKITILWNPKYHISKLVGPAIFWKPLQYIIIWDVQSENK